MNTFGFWTYDELVDSIGIGKSQLTLTVPTLRDVFSVRVNSLRMECFKNDPSCVFCKKRVGVIWVLEAHTNEKPHLNLYAIGRRGGLILMNKDHLIPKSKGGENKLYNLVTSCEPCNTLKRDKIVTVHVMPAMRSITPKPIETSV